MTCSWRRWCGASADESCTFVSSVNSVQMAAKLVKNRGTRSPKLTSTLNQRKEQTMKIVVIGGTGLIGSKLVKKLRGMGADALAASPDTGVNTLTGEGLAEALAGADVVVDVSNSP